MARIALVNNGAVEQIVISTLAAEQSRWHGSCVDVTGQPVAIGWVFDGVEFSAPPSPPVIPQSVTMRQARLALLNHGLLANVAPAIAALSEPAKTRAQIEWEYSNALERDNPFIATLGVALGLDASVIDALFIEAATL